jgi:hypothetical protein
MQKPNAILHMTVYGLIFGFLLAMLYIWGVLMIFGMGWLFENWSDFFSIVLYTPFLWGALPGAAFGFIGGLLLWFLTRNMPIPFSDKEMAVRQRVASYGAGGLVFLGMVFVLTQVGLATTCLILPPPVIAAVAATYGVDRYFIKLRAWGSVGKAKNKAKHSPTNQLAYDYAADDDALLTDESHQQSNDTRR